LGAARPARRWRYANVRDDPGFRFPSIPASQPLTSSWTIFIVGPWPKRRKRNPRSFRTSNWR
jgi:hypothetical protein